MPASLTRTALGLLIRRQSLLAGSLFNAAEWDVSAGVTKAVNGVTGDLELTNTDITNYNWTRFNALAARAKQYVQAQFQMTGAGEKRAVILANVVDIDTAGRDGVAMVVTVQRAGEFVALTEYVNGVGANIGGGLAAVAAKAAATNYIAGVFGDNAGNTASGWDNTSGVAQTGVMSVGDGQAGLGILAASAGRKLLVKRFFVMSDRYLTVTNLPAGATVNVKDAGGVILATANEVAGTATVDMFQELFPAPVRVEVVIAAVITASITPAELVWGGDIYEYDTGNTAPSAPNITEPVAASVHDQSILVAWDAAVDVDANPLEYEGDYSTDGGGSWTPLFALQAGLTYDWDISGIAEQADVRVRVRAHDGLEYGPYSDSGNFTVAHAEAPTAPTVTVSDVDLDRATFTGTAFSDPDVGDTHAASRWQVALASDPAFADPVYDTGWITDLLVHTAIGLTQNEELLVRAAYQDSSGLDSGFGAATAFETALVYSCITPLNLLRELSEQYADIILELGPYLYARFSESAGSTQAADSSGNGRHGVYGPRVAEFGLPGVVEGDTAIRLAGVVAEEVAVSLDEQINLDLRRDFTIGFWAKPTEVTEMPPSVGGGGHVMNLMPGNRWIIWADPGHVAGGDPGNQAGVGVTFGTNGIVVAEHANEHFPARAVYEAAFADDEFHFIMIEVEGIVGVEQSNVRIYVGGVYADDLAGTYTEGLSSADFELFASANMGSSSDFAAGYGLGFVGEVDEWFYFDRILTAEEKLSLVEIPVTQEQAFDCVEAEATAYDCDEDAPTVATFTEIE